MFSRIIILQDLIRSKILTQRYLPLYRKYRPQTFKDLIGQENIVKALSNAINLNKISHAYLLCGPRGTGKTTTARIIAKSLNCAKGPTLEPCGECPSCKDITNSLKSMLRLTEKWKMQEIFLKKSSLYLLTDVSKFT